MPARKKSSTRKVIVSRTTTSNFFTKDLFIFIVIMALVAVITYVLTYNAIMSKFNQQLNSSANYQYLPSK